MTKYKVNNSYGIFFMLLNTFSLALLYAVSKQVTQTMASTQVVFFYKIIVFIMAMPWMFRIGISVFQTPQLKLHIVRGFLSICGSMFFVYGLKHSGLTNSTALGYLEQVLWVIIGVTYFKEKMTAVKVMAIMISIVGAVFIVSPNLLKGVYSWLETGTWQSDTSPFNHYYIYIICGILFWAANSTVIKVLGRTAKNETQVFYVMLFSMIFGAPAALIKWSFIDYGSIMLPTIAGFQDVSISMSQWGYLSILAICYFIHVISFFLSMRYSDMSVIAPFEYSKMIFTGFFGVIIFSEIPSLESFMGYVAIVTGGIVMAYGEYRYRRKIKKIAELQPEIAV